jgi:hypothetical protein
MALGARAYRRCVKVEIGALMLAMANRAVDLRLFVGFGVLGV